MLKISRHESRNQLRLVVKGDLIAPLDGELARACENARTDLHDRQLLVEVKNITAISQAGENVLLALMHDGIKLRACGVFTKHVLKQLARKVRRDLREVS
jgi:hypothetical protein